MKLIPFKYCNEQGLIDENSNPNGSLNNIAGIFNEKKNILGMMPHPERAMADWMGSSDGCRLFESARNLFPETADAARSFQPSPEPWHARGWQGSAPEKI
mgnify:CR=1 FL=1